MGDGRWIVLAIPPKGLPDTCVKGSQVEAVAVARRYMEDGWTAEIAGPLWTPEPDTGPIEDTSGGGG